VHHLKIKKLSIALGLTLLPISVLAAGLGQLNVNSGIGEPLKAEIELLSVSPAEKNTLKANIAPESTYAAQGLDRPASHQGIKVEITKSANGKDILKLQSNQPIDEPYLDMLVEVEWETGRILREYTVLLDPPGYKTPVAAPKVDVPAIKAKSNLTPKPIAKNDQSGAGSLVTANTSALNSNNFGTADDYLTKKGDTLSKIAGRMKPEGVSLDQMLVGLFEANPDAFDGKNMNRLKVGKILQTPTKEALDAIGRKEAVSEIKLQTANWNEYRNKLAGIVESSIPQASEEESQSSSGKIKPATEDQSIPENAGPKDVVKLSSGDTSAVEADMQAKITALQEEVSAREKGLKEAQDRTVALEKQIEDMQKLLTLKSDALAKVQQEEPVEAETDLEQVQAQAEASSELPPEVANPEPTTEAPIAAVEQPKPVTQTPIDIPVEEPSFISSLIANITGIFNDFNNSIVGVAGGLVALLTGIWFYLRNKRRKNLADFEQGIMTSGGLKANTVFGNTSGASVDTGDTSFLTDFSQSTSGGMIDTNDVDPIAEAEVYMAYGRDAQAEEILKDAISKEPKRYELHLKLLEMYAANKDMSAFETVSGELYTTLGAEDPTWAKVAEIGIKLEPNNPLYQLKEGATKSRENSNNETKLDVSDFADSPLAAEADLNFSLNTDVESEEDSFNVSALADKIDHDFDETALDLENVPEVLKVDDSALEFDITPSNENAEVDEDDVSFAHTMPNLDFPTSDVELDKSNEIDEFNEAEADISDNSVDDLSENNAELEAPKLDFSNELSLDLTEDDNTDEVEIQDLAEEESSEPENFGFDINTLSGDTLTLDADDKTAEEELVDVLDMSDITLDVGDSVNDAITEASPVLEMGVTEEAAPESEEVETKLELVAAYIDMEDKEGAKELLDEVLKEGGANQRKRAEEILASIG
jgi:pilus assembly protein FimV